MLPRFFTSLTLTALLVPALAAAEDAPPLEAGPAPTSAKAASPAAAPPAASGPAPAAPATAPEVAAAPIAPAPAPPATPTGTLDERRNEAMARYSAGRASVALEELEALAVECARLGSVGCDQKTEAALYRDIGIVQAGGRGDRDSAVASFHRALALDPTLQVDARYATPPVVSAFTAAQSSTQPPAPKATPAALEADKKSRGFVLVEATGKYGTFQARRYDPYYGYEYAEWDSAGQAGGAVTLGVNPSGRSFTMAGRARGGAYFGNGAEYGYLGMAMLFGGLMGRSRSEKSFGYMMGGAGFEYIPESGADGLTFHALGGAVMHGLAFGGGIDISTSGDNASVMFGVHLGWGSLL